MRRERPSGFAGAAIGIGGLYSPRQAAVEQQREPAQRGVDEERRLERRLQPRTPESAAASGRAAPSAPTAAMIDPMKL